jgi:hypothetical protein
MCVERTPTPHFYNTNMTVKRERNKTVTYVNSDTQKNIFQEAFSVLRFSLDASSYYIIITPTYFTKLTSRHGFILKNTRDIPA